MKFFFVLLFASSFLFSQTNFIQYVKPLTGTQRMGHTFPGATVPFGAVQLSPDTDTLRYEKNGKYQAEVYQYCAGYQYEDKTIVGFSHTHFSGTGHSDLGDFLIMPTTGPLQLNPGTAEHPENGFRSRFSHANETAEPAYYKVKLDDHNITAELTATTRVGVHRYTFPKPDSLFSDNAEAHIILDLMHGIYNYDGKNVWTFVRVENDTLVTGFRQTNGWGRTRTVYFAMTFDRPFISYGHARYDTSIYRGFWRKFDVRTNFPEMAGKNIRAYFNFSTTNVQKVKLKFALSPVSTEGALKNLVTEIPDWDFERVKRSGQEQWNAELGKVNAELLTRKDAETFYTSLYHTLLGPTVYMDVDGRYKGLDQNIHTAEGFVELYHLSRCGIRTERSIRCSISSSRNGTAT
jgi:predicted alpha-1,2-mannosidase